MFELRPFQSDCVDRVRLAMRTHRRVMLVSPTGSGKTVMFSHVAHRVWVNKKRVYILAHRIEIVDQISAALTAFGVRHGVVAPGRYETTWPVQVCMVATLKNRLDRIAAPDLLIIDEGHHAVASMYLEIMALWSGIHILLVTATPQRLDGRGLSEVADVLVKGPTVRWLIENKFLAGFRYIAPPIVADLSALKVKMGDFVTGQVADAVDRREVIGDVESHYRLFFDGAPAVLFGPDVASCRHMAEQFRAKGWKAASVDGSTDPVERRSMIRAVGDGTLNVLMSCAIIDEGTDLPEIAGIINCSPTMSLVRYLQRAGRALRVKSNGAPAIIVDHVGDGTLRHGLPDHIHHWSLEGRKRKSGQTAPASFTCKACMLVFRPAAACPDCGAEVSRALKGSLARTIEAVPGQLQEVTGDWLSTAPLREVLRAATTWDQVDAVRKARNYAPGWTKVQWDLKRGTGAGFRRSA